MFKEERFQEIVEELIAQDSVKVTDLANKFNVSISTIRTDLTTLEQKGFLRRTHGGAILANKVTFQKPQLIEPTLGERSAINMAEKAAIGKAAANLVSEGDTIMIDGGTTTPFVYRNLLNLNNLTIVSSSAALISELSTLKKANIYILGGFLRRETASFVGEITEIAIGCIRANMAILGIDGISLEEGLTTINFLEGGVKKQMIAASQKLIIVADYSKIGKVCLVPVAPIEKVSVIVTDENAPSHIIDAIKEKGIEAIIAKIKQPYNQNSSYR